MCVVCLCTQFYTENHSIYIIFLNILRHHRRRRPNRMKNEMKGEIVTGSGVVGEIEIKNISNFVLEYVKNPFAVFHFR